MSDSRTYLATQDCSNGTIKGNTVTRFTDEGGCIVTEMSELL